jgi:hypothetical protein
VCLSGKVRTVYRCGYCDLQIKAGDVVSDVGDALMYAVSYSATCNYNASAFALSMKEPFGLPTIVSQPITLLYGFA